MKRMKGGYLFIGNMYVLLVENRRLQKQLEIEYLLSDGITIIRVDTKKSSKKKPSYCV